jgi:hypothetical protein
MGCVQGRLLNHELYQTWNYIKLYVCMVQPISWNLIKSHAKCYTNICNFPLLYGVKAIYQDIYWFVLYAIKGK